MTDLVKYGRRELLFNRRPADIEEAEEVAQTLMYFNEDLPWLFGDFLNQCEGFFGEEFAQIIPDKSQKTLRNWMFIAAAIPSRIRHYPLSHSHFASVAGVQDKEKQEELLQKAVQLGWSVKRLRQEVRPGDTKPKKTCPHCGGEL